MVYLRQLLVKILAAFRRRVGWTSAIRIPLMIYPYRLASEHPFTTKIQYLNTFQLYLNTKSHIEYMILLNGIYEKNVTGYISKNLHLGQTALDVGANIGAHTLLMSKCVGESGRVIALEPMPTVREKLENNLRVNLVKNVTVLPVAASNRLGKASIYLPESVRKGTNEGMSILVPEYHKGDNYSDTTTTTIDAIIEEQGITQLALIKIDIEGNEPLALFGAKNTLQLMRPIIVFEFSDGWEKFAQTTFKEVQNYLDSLGYGISQNDKMLNPNNTPLPGELIAIPT